MAEGLVERLFNRKRDRKIDEQKRKRKDYIDGIQENDDGSISDRPGSDRALRTKMRGHATDKIDGAIDTSGLSSNSRQNEEDSEQEEVSVEERLGSDIEMLSNTVHQMQGRAAKQEMTSTLYDYNDANTPYDATKVNQALQNNPGVLERAKAKGIHYVDTFNLRTDKKMFKDQGVPEDMIDQETMDEAAKFNLVGGDDRGNRQMLPVNDIITTMGLNKNLSSGQTSILDGAEATKQNFKSYILQRQEARANQGQSTSGVGQEQQPQVIQSATGVAGGQAQPQQMVSQAQPQPQPQQMVPQGQGMNQPVMTQVNSQPQASGSITSGQPQPGTSVKAQVHAQAETQQLLDENGKPLPYSGPETPFQIYSDYVSAVGGTFVDINRQRFESIQDKAIDANTAEGVAIQKNEWAEEAANTLADAEIEEATELYDRGVKTAATQFEYDKELKRLEGLKNSGSVAQLLTEIDTLTPRMNAQVQVRDAEGNGITNPDGSPMMEDKLIKQYDKETGELIVDENGEPIMTAVEINVPFSEITDENIRREIDGRVIELAKAFPNVALKQKEKEQLAEFAREFGLIMAGLDIDEDDVGYADSLARAWEKHFATGNIFGRLLFSDGTGKGIKASIAISSRLALFLKSISGGQVTDKEREWFIGNIYGNLNTNVRTVLEQTQSLNRQRLAVLKETASHMPKEVAYRYYDENIATLQGYVTAIDTMLKIEGPGSVGNIQTNNGAGPPVVTNQEVTNDAHALTKHQQGS